MHQRQRHQQYGRAYDPTAFGFRAERKTNTFASAKEKEVGSHRVADTSEKVFVKHDEEKNVRGSAKKETVGNNCCAFCDREIDMSKAYLRYNCTFASMYNVGGNSESETKLASAIGHRCLVQNAKCANHLCSKSNPVWLPSLHGVCFVCGELKPRKFGVSRVDLSREDSRGTRATQVPLRKMRVDGISRSRKSRNDRASFVHR